MSGYVTNANGVKDCVEVNGDKLSIGNDLSSDIEEADKHIIPHVAAAVKELWAFLMMLMWLCCFSISSMCSLKWAWKISGSLLERRKLPRHSNSFSKCKVRTTNVQDTIYSAYTNWL